MKNDLEKSFRKEVRNYLIISKIRSFNDLDLKQKRELMAHALVSDEFDSSELLLDSEISINKLIFKKIINHELTEVSVINKTLDCISKKYFNCIEEVFDEEYEKACLYGDLKYKSDVKYVSSFSPL